MNFEGNLAEKMPEKDEAPKEKKDVLKKDIPGTKEYYEYFSAWEPDKLTAKDKENWELLKKGKDPLTEAEKARLRGLRKKQIDSVEGFSQDEMAEFLFLTEKEEKAKQNQN